MIEKITLYRCKYCGETYESEKEALNCLNGHNIIFCIEEYVANHDCWSSTSGTWKSTDRLFKTYESAVNYTKDCNYVRIAYKNLFD